MKSDKEQLISETISSIDNISRAELSPFFKTRIHAALNNNDTLNEVSFIKALAVAGLSLILLTINFIVLNKNIYEVKTSSETSTSSYKDFTYENSFNLNSIYYYDNKQ